MPKHTITRTHKSLQLIHALKYIHILLYWLHNVFRCLCVCLHFAVCACALVRSTFPLAVNWKLLIRHVVPVRKLSFRHDWICDCVDEVWMCAYAWIDAYLHTNGPLDACMYVCLCVPLMKTVRPYLCVCMCVCRIAGHSFRRLWRVTWLAWLLFGQWVQYPSVPLNANEAQASQFRVLTKMLMRLCV